MSVLQMMTLIEHVRFNVGWKHRDNGITDAEVDSKINNMTPLELLAVISEALEDIKGAE